MLGEDILVVGVDCVVCGENCAVCADDCVVYVENFVGCVEDCCVFSSIGSRVDGWLVVVSIGVMEVVLIIGAEAANVVTLGVGDCASGENAGERVDTSPIDPMMTS